MTRRGSSPCRFILSGHRWRMRQALRRNATLKSNADEMPKQACASKTRLPLLIGSSEVVRQMSIWMGPIVLVRGSWIA